MIWSISASRSFRRCQRQWYYKNVLANAKAKDALRHHAYLLSKLQSISAWRGQIVDAVISNMVVPAIKAGRRVTVAEAKKRAHQMFDDQLVVARRHPLHEPSFSPAKNGSAIVLHCMEYGGIIPENEILTAREEIGLALDYFFGMTDLIALLHSAQQVITQRAISFSHSGATIRAVPDVIAFYSNHAPLIIDWKVHAFGVHEAWLQLAVYAQALTNCKPHIDFPSSLARWTPTDINLVEAQLLTKIIRRYSLSDEELARSEAYIADSVTRILLAMGDGNRTTLKASDFPVTWSPSVCERCAFRAICWEEDA